MNVFFLVLARDRGHVFEKIRELESFGFQYKIVCGEQLDHPNVIFQKPKGKYAAINFGINLVPNDTDIIVMNDVDTKIHNFGAALQGFKDSNVGLVFGTELVKEGPQNLFFRILNPIRSKIPIAGSGELLLMRSEILRKMCPLPPCKAEDTYILFKVLNMSHRIVFSEECYAETERTKTADKEELYKRKTVAGIYQALSYVKAPVLIRIFYFSLPIASPILLVMGSKGYFWMRGILLGLGDFLKGDRSGSWKTDYMN
jgi:hypothetical protein